MTKSTKINQTSDRITEYVSTDAVPENIPKTEVAKQPEFYKIPRRFGSIPVEELPLGCDKDEQYYQIYPRISLPFQKAQRISFGHDGLEPNRLFWGDNLHVMRMLPSNTIDLIYIDPPFFSGRNYNVIFGDQNEVRSFTDVWEGGMPGYLVWLNARILEMKRLLKQNGSIYVHLDWHAAHYVKMEMDKIFGYDNFQGEIIWSLGKRADNAPTFSKAHETILFYTKGEEFTFNSQRRPYSETLLKSLKKDEQGRLYYTRGQRTGRRPLAEWEKESKVGLRTYVDLEKGGSKVNTIWDDVGGYPTGREKLGYPTQKPESLLERIIMASSNEESLVADFFCGGGTLPAVAQRLNRRWIACDQSRVAVAITQGRLESMYEEGKAMQSRITPIHDISVEYWGSYEIPTLVELTEDEFKTFIISAFGGRISSAGEYIHGYKKEIPLFVGPPTQENQVTKNDVISFAHEIMTKKGKRQGSMLAWSFAPSARIAVQKLLAEGSPEVDLIKISAIEIESAEFREHVTKLHDEYNSFLTFILPPEVRFSSKRIKSHTYVFDVSESIALNTGSKIINVQWDLDFQGRFTPTKGFAFGRDNAGNPLYKVNYVFDRIGNRTIACRVQDDVGGEKIYSQSISVH